MGAEKSVTIVGEGGERERDRERKRLSPLKSVRNLMRLGRRHKEPLSSGDEEQGLLDDDRALPSSDNDGPTSQASISPEEALVDARCPSEVSKMMKV